MVRPGPGRAGRAPLFGHRLDARYDEINQFEEQLTTAGAVIVKFWLQISPAEQLRRFREREKTAFKRFKITEEDWRNRTKAKAYEAALGDVVDRTSTEIAPWTLVEAEDKRYARLKVLKTKAWRARAGTCETVLGPSS